jgi:hypothetical protein
MDTGNGQAHLRSDLALAFYFLRVYEGMLKTVWMFFLSS